MSLFQDSEHRRAERLDGGDREQAAGSAQLRKQRPAFEDVFHLGRDVEGELRELRVQGPHNFEGVTRSVQEIGVAEGDVRGSRLYLPANIFEDNLGRDDKEAPAVYRWDRTMRA